jgi:hypothetical protein
MCPIYDDSVEQTGSFRACAGGEVVDGPRVTVSGGKKFVVSTPLVIMD